MRFTPSATWSLLESAGSKGLTWKVYARQIDHLSGSLTSGSWSDVSDLIFNFPGAESRIEYEVGEFVTNELQIEGIEVETWRDYVLTTGSAYTEVKVTLNLTDGSKTTGDTPIVFSGFVNRDTVEYNELSDRVRFTVSTPQEVASRIAGEYLTTQYFDGDITRNDLHITGSIVRGIPGLFIRSTDPSSSAVPNGDFSSYTGTLDSDATPTSWTVEEGVVLVTPSGTTGNSLALSNILGNALASVDINIPERKKYEFSFKMKTDTIGGRVHYSIYDNDDASWEVSASFVTASHTSSADLWKSEHFTFITEPGSTSLTIFIGNSDSGTNVWITDVTVIPFTSTVDLPMAPEIGSHDLSYAYSNGTSSLSYDGGRAVDIYPGLNLLGDGDTPEDDRSRVWVHLSSSLNLPQTSVEDKFVVLTRGENLPYSMYRDISGRGLLTAIYSAIGITSSAVDFTPLGMNVAGGGSKIAYLGNPPEQPSTVKSLYGPKAALIPSSSALFIGIGDEVWKYDSNSGSYTYVTSVGSGHEIGRLMFNFRTDDLWIVYSPMLDSTGSKGTGATRVRKYALTSSTLSSEVKLWREGAPDYEAENSHSTSAQSMELYDYEYTPGSYHYGLVFTMDAPFFPTVREVGGTTMTVATIGSQSSALQKVASIFAYKPAANAFTFTRGPAGNNQDHYTITMSAAGEWSSGSLVIDSAGGPPYLTDHQNAAWNSYDGKIYFEATGTVKSHATNSATLTTVITSNADARIGTIRFAGADTSGTYVGIYNRVDSRYDDDGYKLYKITSNVATLLGSGSTTVGYGVAGYGTAFYGLDQWGRLLTYGTQTQPFIPLADFSGGSVRDALNELLNAFGLTSTIYSKTAKVYQRANNAGVLLSTGNTASVTVSQASDLTLKSLPAVYLVTVTNGVETVSYDGTNFDVRVLSDRKKIEVSSRLIDRSIIADVAVLLWGFFGTQRNRYSIPLEAYPAVEYEPFDACSISLGSTKIGTSGVIGIIQSVRIDQNGTLLIEVVA